MLLHRIAPPHWKPTWTAANRTWESISPQRVWGDADLDPLIQDAFPHLWTTVRTFHLIERVDVARYALMHLFGGIYADLDMELVDVVGTKRLLSRFDFVFPLEKGRLVGQAFLFSRFPRNVLWEQLVSHMIARRRPRCTAPFTTGPDALTRAFNDMGVVENTTTCFTDTVIHGPLVRHLETGTWRPFLYWPCRKERLAFKASCP